MILENNVMMTGERSLSFSFLNPQSDSVLPHKPAIEQLTRVQHRDSWCHNYVLTVQGFLPATLTLLIKVGLYFYFKLYFLDDDEEEVKIIYKGMGYY